MTIAAKYAVHQAAETLQDLSYRRWPVAELVRYLNDGRREILVSRPDALAAPVAVTLVDGARQTLPAGSVKLLEVRRNLGGSQRVIRQCGREMLDALDPDWMGTARATEILHFTYDPRTPRDFYVYPPAQVGLTVEAVCSTLPANIAEPVGVATHDDVVGDIGVPDILVNALVNYMLYRAYAKDSESPSSAARAQAFYTAFVAGLGTEVSATVTVGPTTRSTPMSST